MIKRTSTEADIPSDQYSNFVINATEQYNNHLIYRIREEKRRMNKSSVSILDVGTGTGDLLIKLIQDLDFRDDQLVGVDFSESMIANARKNLQDHDLERSISFQLMDVHQMNFSDNTFDLIVGRSIIHHWADPVKALREIHRVLSPDGMVIIDEPSSAPDSNALAYFNDRRAQIGCIPMVLSDKFTPKQITKFLAQAELPRSAVTTGQGALAIGYELCIQKTN